MKRLSIVLLAACSSGYRADAPTTPAAQAAPPAQLRQIGLAAADGATAICPGAPFQVVVTGTAVDGRTVATPTSYRGGAVWYEEHGLPWQRFQITSSVGSMTPAAMFAPPPSIFTLAETRTVQLHAVDLANPQLTADLSVPVDFHCGQTLALRGQAGVPGANGSAGQQGGMGGEVQISVGRLNTRAHGAVIFARVDSALGRNYFLLQPGGGALVVDLGGGDGGRGGEGMHAQVEYRDTDSQGNVDRSQVTYQGPPGPGGAGGPGGSAVIRVDASDRLLAQAVTVYNPGGAGGAGGVNGRGFAAVQAGGGPQGAPGPRPQISYEDPSAIFADEIAQGFPIAQPQVARRAEAQRRH
jgi:hypothetical protein